MRYGILGDVHANLCALEAVLAELDRRGIDRLLSVGDVVGYGAAPRECIAILRERDTTVVLGNHDAAAARLLDDAHFNPYARAAVAWTRGALAPGEVDWIHSLPLVADLEHCHVAHGTYARPERFDYILGTADADPSLDVLERPVCFVGHSHVPLTLLRLTDAPGRTAYTTDSTVDLSTTTRAVVNVGSVGQPRDENPLAAYALYDSETRTVSIERCAYDVEREGQRIRAAGLPEVLATRLTIGV